MLYLFNTNIIPGEAIVRCTKINQERAREIYSLFLQRVLKESADENGTVIDFEKVNTNPTIQSAIGHEATAQAMSLILGNEIKVNRIHATPQPGDVAISLKLNGRLPEGVILTAEQMEEIGFEMYILEFCSPNILLTSASLLDVLYRDAYEDGMIGQGLAGYIDQHQKPYGYPKYTLNHLLH